MAIDISGEAFTLQQTDTATLRYRDPAGAEHVKALAIYDLTAQVLQTTQWNPAVDLPVAGTYYGWVEVARVGDASFPRTYPSDGTVIRWYIGAKQ